jgi:uncharacterized membrane protein HdeD (DUF308 family)
MSLYTMPPDLAESRRHWFLFFLLGVLLMLGGFTALIYAAMASVISVLIWGWMLVFRGVLEAGFAVWARHFSASLLHLLLGILGVVIGVFIATHPVGATVGLTLLLAVFLFVSGLMQTLASLFLHFPGWGYSLASGLLGVVIGVLILSGWPDDSRWFIGTCVGIELFVRGAAWAGLAINLKKR